MSAVYMLKKFFKPWFISNPLVIGRAFLFDIGVVPRGWAWVKTCFCMPIYCDTSKAIGRAIYKNGVYELPTSELIWRLLTNVPNALFVDVGANIGYHSLLARKRLGNQGKVVSFEPMPDIHEKLIKNLQGLDVQAYQYAVSSANGLATLNIPRGSEANDGISTLQDCSDAVNRITVQTISLDGFLDEEIHVLKIDVEGHEYSVLLGAKSLLSQGKIKNIIFEDHSVDDSAVATLLTGLGYKIFSIGWNMRRLTIKPLGEQNSSYVVDAPNYIATFDVTNVEAATRTPGWSVLRGR